MHLSCDESCPTKHPSPNGSRKAREPAVAYDDAVVKQHRTNIWLRAEHNTLRYETKVVNKLLATGEDGTRFIDYLAASGEFDGYGAYLNFLRKHAQIIQQGLKTKDLHSRKKYQWLQRYHNSHVIPLRDAILKDPKQKAEFIEEHGHTPEEYFSEVTFK